MNEDNPSDEEIAVEIARAAEVFVHDADEVVDEEDPQVEPEE